MDFNENVISNLYPLLQDYGFEIVNEFNNYINFSNLDVSIFVSYNEFEQSNSLRIGKKNQQPFTINNKILKSIFNSNLKIEDLSTTNFIENIIIFLNSYAKIIFTGNNLILEEIEKESYKQAEIYTKRINNSQYLDIADKAWLEKDFDKFVKALNKIDLNSIPKSYSLKYEYAKKQ